MSRNAIAVVVAVYFVIAFAFGLVLELTRPLASSESTAFLAVNALETGVLAFIASGIVPLGYWAFRHFRARHAEGPLLVWGMLGIAYMVLFGADTFWHQRIALSHPPEAATEAAPQAAAAATSPTADFRDRFVKSIDAGCVANQKRSASEQHSDITNSQIVTYCQCFAEAIAKEMTDADIMDIAKTAKLPASFEEKADKVTPTCTRLALGH
jgi:hypothetical protein